MVQEWQKYAQETWGIAHCEKMCIYYKFFFVRNVSNSILVIIFVRICLKKLFQKQAKIKVVLAF